MKARDADSAAFKYSDRPRRSLLPSRLAIRTLLAVLLVWAASTHALGVKSIGAPVGTAIGTPDAIALLISTQASYMPSLHRDPTRDRFHLSLLLVPRKAGAEPHRVRVSGPLDASQAQNAARMLGFDGRMIWFVAGEVAAYDTKAQRVIRLDDLRRANPGLDALWPVGHYEVTDRLVVSTRDNKVVVAVDPQTLAASTLAAPPRRRALPPHPVTSLLSSAPARADGTLDPAYVREGVDAPALRLSPSGDRLVTYWRKQPDFQRMLYVARVDAAGSVAWETRTGIADLQQVIPDPVAIALIGTRPRVPNKVPEPILLMLRNDTGATHVHSLWMRD